MNRSKSARGESCLISSTSSYTALSRSSTARANRQSAAFVPSFSTTIVFSSWMRSSSICHILTSADSGCVTSTPTQTLHYDRHFYACRERAAACQARLAASCVGGMLARMLRRRHEPPILSLQHLLDVIV